jgi:hypothetical protein
MLDNIAQKKKLDELKKMMKDIEDMKGKEK